MDIPVAESEAEVQWKEGQSASRLEESGGALGFLTEEKCGFRENERAKGRQGTWLSWEEAERPDPGVSRDRDVCPGQMSHCL